MSDYFGSIGTWETYCEFFVRGKPRPQPRQRHFAMKTKNGRYQARAYNPGTAEGWKAQIALVAKGYLPTTPLDGPVCVSLTFSMPRPKSHYRTGKYAGELKITAPYWHVKGSGIGGGDRDNLDKAVLDTLTQIGMWHDDGLVCAGTIQKRYMLPQECSGVTICIKRWKGMSK